MAVYDCVYKWVNVYLTYHSSPTQSNYSMVVCMCVWVHKHVRESLELEQLFFYIRSQWDETVGSAPLEWTWQGAFFIPTWISIFCLPVSTTWPAPFETTVHNHTVHTCRQSQFFWLFEIPVLVISGKIKDKIKHWQDEYKVCCKQSRRLFVSDILLMQFVNCDFVVLFTWHLLHVCPSWERDPSSVALQRMLFTVQIVEPTEAMWLWFWAIKQIWFGDRREGGQPLLALTLQSPKSACCWLNTVLNFTDL